MSVNGNPTPSIAIIIRPACPADAHSVYTFLCELEEELLSRPAFDAIYEQNLANPQIHYLIAEFAGEVVGFVSCHVQHLLHHVGKVGEIQELFVKANYRNQRIGHQLVKALDTLAQQEGFINLEVTTNQKRLDTVRFYERELFHRTHVKLIKPLQH
ncbi:GNAT family N-acetyltransferase [Spirosoma sp. SC4-14]|uniref:GNAT family N-acetyltransferase n=1 Tax=Spirosoma sp. SC4-14 TaxID=3128900 RepID=UPI0030D0508C